VILQICLTVMTLISSGSTKPPAYPEDWDRVSPKNVGKPSRVDVAVRLRKYQWILSLCKLQDLCRFCCAFYIVFQ